MKLILSLEIAFGADWQNEVPDDARIEPRAPMVLGLSPPRYVQLWQLWQGRKNTDVLICLARGLNLAETADYLQISEKQIRNIVRRILDEVQKEGRTMLRSAGQRCFTDDFPDWPPRRPPTRRGRPKKMRETALAEGD